MKREVQSLLLVLIGGTLLRLWVSRTFENFVKPGLGPWLMSAGVTLAVLGLWGAVHDDALSKGVTGPQQDCGQMAQTDIRDDDEHRGLRAAWLLLLPVLTIFLVAPPPLGSFAAGRGAVSGPQPVPEHLPALNGDPVNLGVVDFVARAVWDNRRTLEGHRVRMIGFVAEAPGRAWYLTRMQITCCAADAEPFRIKAMGARPFPADTWVRVVGQWVPEAGAQRSDAIPTLKVESVVEVAQPTNPYE